MEQPGSWITYWWIIVPIAALLYFGYVTIKRGASRPAQAALASVIFGVAGLLFSPLAVYFARKASRAGRQMDRTDRTVTLMSQIGVVLGVIGHLFLVPEVSVNCHSCPRTILLPMCPDRTLEQSASNQ